jgi:hypothetical protein
VEVKGMTDSKEHHVQLQFSSSMSQNKLLLEVSDEVLNEIMQNNMRCVGRRFSTCTISWKNNRSRLHSRDNLFPIIGHNFCLIFPS